MSFVYIFFTLGFLLEHIFLLGISSTHSVLSFQSLCPRKKREWKRSTNFSSSSKDKHQINLSTLVRSFVLSVFLFIFCFCNLWDLHHDKYDLNNKKQNQDSKFSVQKDVNEKNKKRFKTSSTTRRSNLRIFADQIDWLLLLK